MSKLKFQSGFRHSGRARRHIFTVSYLLASMTHFSCGHAADPQETKTVVSESSVIAASYLQALLSNNSSLKSFEVQFRHESLGQSSDGAITTKVAVCRLIRSSTKDSYLSITAYSDDNWGDDGRVSAKNHAVMGGCFTKNHPTFLIDRHGFRRLKVVDQRTLMRVFRIPTFLAVGLNSFPDLASDEDETQRFWTRVSVAGPNLKYRALQDRKMMIGLTVGRERIESINYHWVFDDRLLVPESRSVSTINNETGERTLVERSSLKWVEKGSVMLPLAIRTTRLVRFPVSGTNNLETMEHTYDTDFNWIRVNVPIEDASFDITELKKIDLDEFLAMETADTAP